MCSDLMINKTTETVYIFVIKMGDKTIKNTGIHFNKIEYLVPRTYDQ
jgi:hypothetical protein